VELLPYADEHLALTEALELDPEVMRELGGPADPAGVQAAHRRRVDSVAKGDWWFVVVPEPSSPPAGAIGIWDSDYEGSPIDEIGWMVLPEFQGRGIASEALGLIVARARADPRFSRIHAFPGVLNVPSNALCRKFGFTQTETTEVRFRDRPLRVNHWELDVSEAASAA
jgi:RimJ/RimL family protein N-acetyltransferase